VVPPDPGSEDAGDEAGACAPATGPPARRSRTTSTASVEPTISVNTTTKTTPPITSGRRTGAGERDTAQDTTARLLTMSSMACASSGTSAATSDARACGPSSVSTTIEVTIEALVLLR
jgi:hypothetical protein